jgi:sulfate transporter 4
VRFAWRLSRAFPENITDAHAASSSVAFFVREVGLVLLLLTSVFELLPTCIIGAIIIAGVITLVDYPEAIRLWKFDKLDFCVWAFTFLGVLFLSPEWGLLCGVSASFLLVVIMSALPKTRVLGRLPGTQLYRSVKQYPEAESAPGCIVTSPDSPLYFLNAHSVKEKITSRAAEMDAETGVFTRYIVLDLASSSDIDSCALHELDDWLHELAGSAPDAAVTGAVADGDTALEGILARKLCVVNPNSTVMRRMEQWGFVERLGRERIFCSVNEAVAWCLLKVEEEEVNLKKLVSEITV